MTDQTTPDPITRLNAALEGRYRIERELGAGGMATVYLAEDVKHDRQVAIKVLRPELAAVIGAERFLAEIKTTANLQHPHILPLFDSGESDGFLYYVMPFIDGESLRQHLDREKQLGVDEAIRIAKDVGDALEYAHSQGVIHRDIKPANILLHRGRPVVADFGIAVAISAAGGGRMTETGLSLGTPHYMSPEQASADRDLSARSDVYSLGCVLYEMIAGQPPHTGPSAQSVLVRIMTEAPRNLTEVRHTVPPHVASVVAKAVEKLPADRFESAQAMIDALEDEGFTYTARPVSRSQAAAPAPVVVAPAAARSRWATLLPWGLVGALALVLLLDGIGSAGGSVAASFPTTRTSLSLGDLALNTSDRVEVSPSGDRFLVAGGIGGEKALYVRNADEAEFRLVPGTEGASDPAFSPDGEWVVFGSPDGLMKVSLAGGAPRPIAPGFTNVNPSPHWGEDGTVVFRDNQSLLRVSENGGVPEVVLGEGSVFNARLLPGGRGVIATNRSAGTTVFIDFESDSAATVIPDGIDARYLKSGHLLYLDQAGGLWSVPFDESTGTTVGPTVPLFGGISQLFGYYGRYSVSETGTLVYESGGSAGGGGGNFELGFVDLEGAVSADPLSPRGFIDAAWSPDGERVAYIDPASGGGASTATFDLYVYNAALRTTPNVMTFTGTNFRPVWSPDGTRIVFGSNREGSDGFDLVVKEVDTDAAPTLLISLPGGQFPTDWIEGDTILFESNTDQGSTDLWMLLSVSPDSVEAVPYLESESDLNGLQVHPGGGWAAYSSDESGVSQVYVRSFPVPRQQVMVSEEDAERPAWSPDGSTLYYWSSGGGRSQLQAASLEVGQTISVLERRILFEGPFRSYPTSGGLHPEGDRFVIRSAAGSPLDDADETAQPPARHFVVTNWFDELRRAMGEGN